MDKRTYRAIRLSNNIEAVVISDPDTSLCGASLGVGVGSLQNPKDIQGLAHLLEHMLFLGTKADPNAGGKFTEYISNHYGGSNAYTSSEKTVYYFQVAPDGFDKALKYFSEMIGEPSLNQTMMSKEIHAVNSEYQKNYNNDNWRESALLKVIANNTSSFSFFSTGSDEVFKKLNETYLHSNLEKFYDKYYVPKNMKLVVLSNKPLDDIAYLVDNLFSGIRTIDSTKTDDTLEKRKYSPKEFPFEKNKLGKMVWYKRVETGQTIKFDFFCDELLSSFLKSKPSEILKYILSYSGKNSFIKYLKKEKLAVNINIDTSENFRSYSFVSVQIELTKFGITKIKNVIDVFFYYLNFLRIDMIHMTKGIHNDLKRIWKQNFGFKEKSSSVGKNLADLAANMFDCPYGKLLEFDYLIKSYSQDEWDNFIKQFIPDNSIITIGTDYDAPDNLVSSYFSNSDVKKEHWYQTVYRTSQLTSDQIKYLNVFPKTNFDGKFGPKELNIYISNEKNIIKPAASCSKTETARRVSVSEEKIIENVDKEDGKSYTKQYFLKKRVLSEKEKVENKAEKKVEKYFENKNKMKAENKKIEKKSQRKSLLDNSPQCSIFEYVNVKKGIDEITPDLIEQGSQISLWYKKDSNFGLPKTIIKLKIIVDNYRYPFINFYYLKIFLHYLEQNLIEGNLKDAVDAGNMIDLDFDENGIFISLDCYKDICESIVTKIFNTFFTEQVLEVDFNAAFELATNRLNEQKTSKPYQKINKIFRKIVKVNYPLYSDLLRENQNINFDTFIAKLNNIRQLAKVTFLFYGNEDETSLRNLFQQLSVNLNGQDVITADKELNLLKHHKLTGSTIYRQNNDLPNEMNHVIKNYYQIGYRDYKNFSLFEIMDLCWGRLFFYELRTLKQLGYIVSSGTTIIDNIMYFTVVIQGTKETPDQMNKDIDEVLRKAKEKIDAMSEDDLSGYKDTLTTQIKHRDENLLKRANRIWKEIITSSNDFHRKSKLLDALSKINLTDINNIFKEIFINSPNKLSIQVLFVLIYFISFIQVIMLLLMLKYKIRRFII